MTIHQAVERRIGLRRRAPSPPDSGRRSRGQILVLFVAAFVVIVGAAAIVIDVAWYWSSTLRVQRAADAAALAGVVNLPSNFAAAQADAYAEAAKNGFTNGVNGVVVTPTQAVSSSRRLQVEIQAPINTFFMHVFGISTITADRTATAEFVLPVPMGSPQSYFGVGCMDTHGSEPSCITSGNSNGPSGVSGPPGTAVTGLAAPNQLASQGFWGVSFTKGGDSRNGDAYLPLQVSGPTGSNQDYDPAGYSYSVVIPTGGGGAVYVFDPGFCGMPTLGSGRAGTGDEWTTNMGGTNPSSVSTYYNLWRDVNNTPYDPTDDQLVYASGSTFENERQVDESGAHGSGTPQYASGSNGVTRCDRPGDPGYAYHLKWWKLPTTALAAGTYRLQITTTKVSTAVGGGTIVADPTVNATTGAANRWSLAVTSSSGSPRVYGSGRMASYANVQSGTQRFYLAQIDQASGAAKTAEIDLFDPGDLGGGGWLQILSPDNAANTTPYAYTPVQFSYSSTSKATGAAGPSGTNVTCIETNRPGSAPSFTLPAGCPAIFDGAGSQFDAYWLKILVPLPPNYGQNGLTPTGETQPGWWKIQYSVAGGNDTTTWQVSLRGNPVHLIK